MEVQFQMPPTGFKRLFYDIETSPNIGLFWQSGYKLNIDHSNNIQERAIICICWKWEGQKEVHSVTWDKGCDKAALSTFMKIAVTADELIGHNGDNFDEKWIRTRCLLHSIECPPKLDSLDTLKKARQHFRFNSNRLDYIGKFLGLGGKIETTYGLWKDILLKNCEVAMADMVKYCKKDVDLLEQVFHRLQPFITHNHHAGEKGGFGRYSCPKCGHDNPTYQKMRVTKAGTKRHQLSCKSGCGYFTVSNAVWMQKLKAEIEEKIATANM